MHNNWFFMDLDRETSYILPFAPLLSQSFSGHLFSHFTSLLDNSTHPPGSMDFPETLNCTSQLVGSLLFWFTSAYKSNFSRQISNRESDQRPGNYKSPTIVTHITSTRHNFASFSFISRSEGESFSPVDFGKVSTLMMRFLRREAARLQSLPIFSLATALIPPFDNLSRKVLAVPLENGDIKMHKHIDQRPCEVDHRTCPGLALSDLNWTIQAIEPKTGIEFPLVLGNLFNGEKRSSLTSEVLVGTGSRTMTIIKIKSLKVYAFGFYVHPKTVCEKLGPKYASVAVGELNKSNNLYKDLLREDIGMTVRLVINCNGMKINTVRNAFEKSLRARLHKTNPNTDYNCLTTFGSLFTKDIPLPAGTTVDFRRTADGQLITEIGGNQIGSVHSKDLCRAFFDMYIGDVPVSEQTKEEIGKNVVSIIRKC